MSPTASLLYYLVQILRQQPGADLQAVELLDEIEATGPDPWKMSPDDWQHFLSLHIPFVPGFSPIDVFQFRHGSTKCSLERTFCA